MPEPPSDCPERPTPPDPWAVDPSLPPIPKVRSLEPGDQTCEHVLQERARRKAEDEGIFRQLDSIRAGVDTTRKITGRIALGIGTIIMAAALEYMGVLGNGTPPIWARVVIDALGSILGK